MPKTRRETQSTTTTLPVSTQEELRRLQVAHAQLQAEPGGRLGWLVRFAREDPAKWLPGDQEAHRYRLLACAVFSTFERQDRLFGFMLRAVHKMEAKMGPFTPSATDSLGRSLSALTSAGVLALHAELKTFFSACVTGPGWQEIEIPTAGLRMAIVRCAKPGEKPATMARTLGGTFRATLWHSIADWLVATDRLLACPTCGEPFLALRKRLFCSPTCLQAHHDRKKIEKRKAQKERGAR